jgi:hypothetical protein
VHASGYEKYAEYKTESTDKVERIILDEPFIKQAINEVIAGGYIL